MRKKLIEAAKWNDIRLSRLADYDHATNKPVYHPKRTYNKKNLRISTTEATIILSKLFPQNTTLFIAFLIYRLKMDLGFTVAEVCNFTGLTKSQLKKFVSITQNLLYLKVFDILEKEDIQKEIEIFQWRRFSGQPLCWYSIEKHKILKELGFVGRFHEFKKIEQWKFFHNNTYEHFKRWFGEWKKYREQPEQSNQQDQQGNQCGKTNTEPISTTTEIKTASSRQGNEGSG